MLTIQQLLKEIEALSASRISLDGFEDWFLSSSWGLYGGDLSGAIAAIHHVLHSYQIDELTEDQIGGEMANAIRPFVEKAQLMALPGIPCVRSKPIDMSFDFGATGLAKKPPASSSLSQIEERNLVYREELPRVA